MVSFFDDDDYEIAFAQYLVYSIEHLPDTFDVDTVDTEPAEASDLAPGPMQYIPSDPDFEGEVMLYGDEGDSPAQAAEVGETLEDISSIFGVLALVPCLGLICGPLAMVFAILGFRRGASNTEAIARLIWAVVATAVSLAATLSILGVW